MAPDDNRSAPETAHRELAALTHTACHPALRAALVTALSDEGLRTTHGRGRGERAQTALLRAAPLLPAPEELLDDPHRLADLQAFAAVLDPALYMALVNHYVLCLGAVLAFGDDEQALRPYKEALRKGEAKGVFLVTETAGAGSHLAPGTVARYDRRADEFLLDTPTASATKFSSVPRRGTRTVAVVCARTLVDGTDHGVFPFLVDLVGHHGPRPGVEVSGPIGVDALPLDYALVRFRAARVPRGQWLSDTARIDRSGLLRDPCGSPAARLRRTMSVGQALWGAVPAAMAAMARESVVAALQFAGNRRVTGHPAPGTPLLGLRTHQLDLYGALADLFALLCAADAARRTPTSAPRTTEAGRHACTAAAVSADSGLRSSPWVAVSPSLALFKAAATESATRILRTCQRACGLAGFLNVNALPDWRGAAEAFTVAGGDNQVIFLDAGREAITSSAGKDQPPESPGGVPDRDGPSGAGAVEWWPRVLRAHEHVLVAGLRRELHTRQNDLRPALARWNDLLPGTRELGETMARRMLADCLLRTVTAVSSPALRAALHPLAALFGASQAHRHAGRLVATGILEPSDARALPEVIDRLCTAVEPHVPLLVEELSGPDVPGRPTLLGAQDYAGALWSAGHAEATGPSAGAQGRSSPRPSTSTP